MNKTGLGITLAAALLLGSSLTVCAKEEGAAQVQNYQQIMTPEILASFENITAEMEEEEAERIVKDAIVLRTDVWETMQDEDGDGIDDRDPINGCGYIDLNCNGLDDRFEMALINVAEQEEPTSGVAMQQLLNLASHRCPHGMTASTFVEDPQWGYLPVPDYSRCPECANEIYNLIDSASAILLEANLV